MIGFREIDELELPVKATGDWIATTRKFTAWWAEQGVDHRGIERWARVEAREHLTGSVAVEAAKIDPERVLTAHLCTAYEFGFLIGFLAAKRGS